jgi:molybdate transport system ATP-binding protein
MSLQVALRHQVSGFALDLAFEAPAGITALIGPSGAGKTTVVNAVAGLMRPDEARIVCDGTVLTDTARGLYLPAHRRRIGYVFQDARLFPHLTVRQNLLYGRWFAPKPPKRGPDAVPEFDRIVDLLGIAALLARRTADLSGGERQRVALGRAILSSPRILLMDEPLAALDEARKADILPYLERLRDDLALPILYVSHSPAEIARLATTVVMLKAGRVVATGPASQVLADPALAPALGLREAGAVLSARVAAQEADGLTRLDTPAGPILVPQVDLALGAALRLRIPAQDVIIATEMPRALSALNILPATVRDIRMGDGPGALVRLQAGDAIILARITGRSVRTLALTPGCAVFAVLKAVSVARENVGG